MVVRGEAPAADSSPSSITNSGVASTRAVVDRLPPRASAAGDAEPHLVQDPARLLLAQRVHHACPGGGQRLQRAQGQGRVDRQRHPRREQRVPAEQRHEPRRPGGHHDPVRDGPGPRCAGRPGRRSCGRVRSMDGCPSRTAESSPPSPAGAGPGARPHQWTNAGRGLPAFRVRHHGHPDTPVAVGGNDSRGTGDLRANAAPGARTTTPFRTSCQTASIVSASSSAWRVCSQRRWIRASFTSKRSAKSASTASAMSQAAG